MPFSIRRSSIGSISSTFFGCRSTNWRDGSNPILRDAGLWTVDLLENRREWLFRLIDLIRPRVKKLDQFIEEMRPFLQQDVQDDPSAVTKHLGKRRGQGRARFIRGRIDGAWCRSRAEHWSHVTERLPTREA